jgi:hypothetical protein
VKFRRARRVKSSRKGDLVGAERCIMSECVKVVGDDDKNGWRLRPEG